MAGYHHHSKYISTTSREGTASAAAVLPSSGITCPLRSSVTDAAPEMAFHSMGAVARSTQVNRAASPMEHSACAPAIPISSPSARRRVRLKRTIWSKVMAR